MFFVFKFSKYDKSKLFLNNIGILVLNFPSLNLYLFGTSFHGLTGFPRNSLDQLKITMSFFDF